MFILKVKGKIFSNLKILFIRIFLSKDVKLGKNINVRRRFNPNVNGGKLLIGSNVFFNNNCSINCQGTIEIGNDCLFGENVKIYDHNHIFSDLYTPIAKQGMKVGKVKIGNNCWIGSNTTILANVEIGDNVVIGANCLVYKSIPSNSLVKSQTELIIKNRE
ncbi:acyltransferase [Sutcliffiella horikoshii]|uniref:Acyltransferase n=1 Tax=Sutcliffiella horikoshii TaxID=79883 RepID=A0AA95B7R4_9BACI|nr:acyltransferase [Sutcliffiella horikoshii]TYS59870.1 acyltransferase [Sutcliffiella horikoshii]